MSQQQHGPPPGVTGTPPWGNGPPPWAAATASLVSQSSRVSQSNALHPTSPPQGPPSSGQTQAKSAQSPGHFHDMAKVAIGVSCLLLVLCTAAVTGRLLARRMAKVSLEADDLVAIVALVGEHASADGLGSLIFAGVARCDDRRIHILYVSLPQRFITQKILISSRPSGNLCVRFVRSRTA